MNTLQSFNLYNVHENVYTFREIDPSDHVIHFSPLHMQFIEWYIYRIHNKYVKFYNNQMLV